MMSALRAKIDDIEYSIRPVSMTHYTVTMLSIRNAAKAAYPPTSKLVIHDGIEQHKLNACEHPNVERRNKPLVPRICEWDLLKRKNVATT